jgi:hypothetical protein
MSETINYLVFDTKADAIAKAEAEGRAMGLPYYSTDSSIKKGSTKYKTYPQELSNGKWALNITEYSELTDDEINKIVSSVTFKPAEE